MRSGAGDTGPVPGIGLALRMGLAPGTGLEGYIAPMYARYHCTNFCSPCASGVAGS